MTDNKLSSILVIGGGISGIEASLTLAEQGYKVILVEKSSSIGGRMAQLDKTFPHLIVVSVFLHLKWLKPQDILILNSLRILK